MAILKPDKTTTLGAVTVNEFLLTKHNPRNIAMPSVKMEGIIGVTIHNTSWIKNAKGTTPAEQYTRATYNGNMNDVRVHYIMWITSVHGRICLLTCLAGTLRTAAATATARPSPLSAS